MASKLTDADYLALADFRFSLRQFQAFSEGKAAQCGLTPQQHQAMLVIRAAPDGATIGRVADRLILKPHSATGLVNRMESLGLVRRQPSPQDKRQALLSLTPNALQMLETLSTTHRVEIRRLRPMLAHLLQSLAYSEP